MRTIYCDLDGVLFDFDKRLQEIFDGDVPTNKDVLWDTLKQYPNLYSEIKPYKASTLFLNYVKHLCIEYKYNLCILTAIPRLSTIPFAMIHKRDAVFKHFGYIDFKIGPYAKDKQNHYQPGDILIDDKESNFLQWQAKGGKAILHIRFSTTLETLEQTLKEQKN
jgi:hypothetical protein